MYKANAEAMADRVTASPWHWGRSSKSRQVDERTSDKHKCPVKSPSPIFTRLSTSPRSVGCTKTVSVDTAIIPYDGDFSKCTRR